MRTLILLLFLGLMSCSKSIDLTAQPNTIPKGKYIVNNCETHTYEFTQENETLFLVEEISERLKLNYIINQSNDTLYVTFDSGYNFLSNTVITSEMMGYTVHNWFIILNEYTLEYITWDNQLKQIQLTSW